MTKTIEERISALDVKMAEMAKKKRGLQRQKNEDRRKERTHRLIQAGAIISEVLNRELTDDDLPRLKSFLEKQEQRGDYFSRAMNMESESYED